MFDTLLLYEDEEKLAELELSEIIREPFVESSLFDFFTKSKMFTPTLWHSVYYYAFLVFITDEALNIEKHKQKLNEWMRLTRNLIYNTYIQNPDNFNNALKQIELMSLYKMDIYASVTNGLFTNSFFESSQFEEEKIKISLLSDENWKREIVRTENHEYFYGQIKFILNFSQKEGVCDLDLFYKYSNCISQLYGSDIRKSKEKLLQRTLLSIGDYLPARSANYIFCSSTAGGLRAINENWRLYFKGDRNKREYLKTLVDTLNTNEITEDVLKNYLDTYIETNLSDNSEWKSLFIKYPEAILFCKESAIRWFSESNIRLLKGGMIVAYHAELRTYCFFLKHKANDGNAPEIFSPFAVFGYFEDKGTDGHPGCYLSGFVFDNKEYRIDIRYSFDQNADTFEVCFYHSTDSIEERNADERITFLLSEYQFDEKYKHYRKFVKYTDLDNELVEICTKLKTL